MCTTAEGYSNGPSIIQRCEDRRRKIAVLRRKIANPSVPMGKCQRLCYELMRLGERRLNLLRAYNAREGFDRTADTLPKKMQKARPVGQ